MAGEAEIPDVPSDDTSGDEVLGSEPAASVPWWATPWKAGNADDGDAFGEHVRRGDPWTTAETALGEAFEASDDAGRRDGPASGESSPGEAFDDAVRRDGPASDETSLAEAFDDAVRRGDPWTTGASFDDVVRRHDAWRDDQGQDEAPASGAPAAEAPTAAAIGDQAPGEQDVASDPLDVARPGGLDRRVRGMALAVAALVTTSVVAGWVLVSDDSPAEEPRELPSAAGAPERSPSSAGAALSAGVTVTAPSTTSPGPTAPAAGSPAVRSSSTPRAATAGGARATATPRTAAAWSPVVSPQTPTRPGPTQPPPPPPPRAEAYNDSSSCTVLEDGTVEVWASVEWTDGFVDSAVVIYDRPGRYTLTMQRMWSFTFDVIGPPEGTIGALSCVALGGGGPASWP